MISRDHLLQLIFRIVQCLGIFPLDGPVDGHLSPDHQSHLIGHAQHGLVVGVVRQANEIAAQFFCPTQECPRIVVAPSPAGSGGSLLMDADSA